MRLNVMSNDGAVTSVSAVGQITQNAFGAEDEPLARALGDEVYGSRLLLSLQATDYVDSRGVGWLLKLHRRFCQAGGIVVLHSIPPTIQEVLKVLHMDEILNISADEQAARAKVQGTADA